MEGRVECDPGFRRGIDMSIYVFPTQGSAIAWLPEKMAWSYFTVKLLLRRDCLKA